MDSLTPEQRSYRMSVVRGRDTDPELAVRKALHSRGYRYCLHVSRLPGKPDIVFPSRRKVVFVHVEIVVRPARWAHAASITVAA